MPNVRRRYVALAACSLIATVLPLSAVAEYGIPAGTGAVVTSGQPLLVRVSPGWDAPVSYEIADGSYVTVWDVAQTAPDGSLWYPVDGGFVPAEGVTSQATLDGGVALYQDAAPEAQTDAAAAPTDDVWLDSASLQGWVDPNTGQWVDPSTSQGWVDPNTGQWVDPSSGQGWVDPNSGQWVDPATSQGWVDPNTGQWVDPSTAQGWVDPNTGQWVDATKSQEWTDETTAGGWVDPNTGQWVDASTAQGWVDPNTGQWVDATTTQDAVTTQDLADPNAAQPADATSLQGWVDPNTGQWVDPTTAQGWVDPNTGQWVDASTAQPVVSDDGSVALAQEAVNADGWADPAPATSGGVESWGEPIGSAYISGTNGEGAVCRPAPERGGGKLAVLGEGDTVEVRGEAVGEWQPVNCAGVGGYINTSFLAWQPVELEQHGRRDRDNDNNNGGGGKVNDSAPASNGGGGGSAGGQQIASFAQQYLGYPYAYAGEGPYAFDCSGFTKFVILNTVGIDITHDMFTQVGMGQSVGESDLQPGDLVFFANTFRPGLSHAGVYVGSGQFVHAENESTGVVQSDLFSDYYGSRWYGGTRIGG
jgi:cell wall-associated NlpC family hydrolase